MANPNLLLSFEPDAIRSHFEDRDDSVAEYVRHVDDSKLAEIGEECLGRDQLWRTFHDLLTQAVEARLEP